MRMQRWMPFIWYSCPYHEFFITKQGTSVNYGQLKFNISANVSPFISKELYLLVINHKIKIYFRLPL